MPELWRFSWTPAGHAIHQQPCNGLTCKEEGEQELPRGGSAHGEERARLVLFLSAWEALLRRALFAAPSSPFHPLGPYAILAKGQGDGIQWELFFTDQAVGVDLALIPTRLHPLRAPASLSPLIGEKGRFQI